MTSQKVGDLIEILLVEDNAGDVRLTKEALKEAKIANRLHVARDGMQAIQFLGQDGSYAEAPRPSLVLLDLNLPKKSGHDVLEYIKKDPKLRRIPVVILSSSKAEEDVLKSYDNHANSYVTKPVDLDQFLNVVKKIDEFWFAVVTLPNEPG